MNDLVTERELQFAIRLGVAVLCGMLIGLERESRKKPAGVSTHCFVIAGAALFTFLSAAIDPASPARIAAQVISGVGFLGAGMILKSDAGTVTNLTTAAAVWFAAAIGMAIGFGWYVIAVASSLFAVVVPRIPHLSTWGKDNDP
ncbi:MAG: MgtC/SapB family protein [Kofleriaceae bacterium]|jgi:putative Mg2+ transporter-C (MgtC) family protein|nr:MgtC/SapB family protein [Kofleriaceae bacterium]MBP6839795.1 MgtC/SapB family protein [Kofleriaceae bacterium]MBP9207452.1 MgtC/SapB family protein [Kofleriaceae bacterium]